MEKINPIQIFNASDLASGLLNFGAKARAIITQVHPIFHINRIEEYIKLVKFPTKGDLLPRKMTVFSIFFLTKGESIRRKGLNNYPFGENSIFFTPAYEISTHEYISPDAEGFYIHFNIDLLTTDFRLKDLLKEFPFLNFNAYPIITIESSAKDAILNIMQRLEQEYKLGEKCRHEILRIYLVALFTELNHAPLPTVSTTSQANILTEQFKNALAKHILQKQKVNEYAEMLHVTPNHLNKCIQQTLNQSALDLIHEMLLLEAKVLLKQTSLSIAEIAHAVGREEPADFARFFKSKAGITPKEYRNS